MEKDKIRESVKNIIIEALKHYDDDNFRKIYRQKWTFEEIANALLNTNCKRDYDKLLSTLTQPIEAEELRKEFELEKNWNWRKDENNYTSEYTEWLEQRQLKQPTTPTEETKTCGYEYDAKHCPLAKDRLIDINESNCKECSYWQPSNVTEPTTPTDEEIEEIIKQNSLMQRGNFNNDGEYVEYCKGEEEYILDNDDIKKLASLLRNKLTPKQ